MAPEGLLKSDTRSWLSLSSFSLENPRLASLSVLCMRLVELQCAGAPVHSHHNSHVRKQRFQSVVGPLVVDDSEPSCLDLFVQL